MPIDCLDIANIISENVVVGGVRRTAEIVLMIPTTRVYQAKNELYKKVDEKWVIDTEIAHRQMSNNSLLYASSTREQLHGIWSRCAIPENRAGSMVRQAQGGVKLQRRQSLRRSPSGLKGIMQSDHSQRHGVR